MIELFTRIIEIKCTESNQKISLGKKVKIFVFLYRVIEIFIRIHRGKKLHKIESNEEDQKFLYFYTMIVIEIYIKITKVKCSELNKGRYGRED